MPAVEEEARHASRRRSRRDVPRRISPAHVLEQRQLDLIGLGLVALALFFAFLVYFGWDGGRAGSQAVEGLRWLLGAGHYLVPVALAAARRDPDAAARSCPPCGRSASGAICLFVAVTLGLSAGTRRPGRRAPGLVGRDVGQDPRRHDGGDARLGRRRRSPGSVGAHILAVFLFIAGVLLLTGASVAGVIKATSDSVSTTTRELRDAVEGPRRSRAPTRRSTTSRRSSSPPACASSARRPRRRRGDRASRRSSKLAAGRRSPSEERCPELFGADEPRPEPASRARARARARRRAATAWPRTRPRTSPASRAARPSRSSRGS